MQRPRHADRRVDEAEEALPPRGGGGGGGVSSRPPGWTLGWLESGDLEAEEQAREHGVGERQPRRGSGAGSVGWSGPEDALEHARGRSQQSRAE